MQRRHLLPHLLVLPQLVQQAEQVMDQQQAPTLVLMQTLMRTLMRVERVEGLMRLQEVQGVQGVQGVQSPALGSSNTEPRVARVQTGVTNW